MHIRHGEVWKHSVYICIQSAVALQARVQEGSIHWLKIPNSYWDVSHCNLHYSHPIDIPAAIPKEGVSLSDQDFENSPFVEMRIYGNFPGDHRRQGIILCGTMILFYNMIFIKKIHEIFTT